MIETALNFILYDWKNLISQNKEIIAVFLDLQGAYETLDRKQLLLKLDMYGIRGIEN